MQHEGSWEGNGDSGIGRRNRVSAPKRQCRLHMMYKIEPYPCVSMQWRSNAP